jgi:hypothetical protein
MHFSEPRVCTIWAMRSPASKRCELFGGYVPLVSRAFPSWKRSRSD